MNRQLTTRKMTLMAMFAALAYLLMAVGRIPISSVSFLKYDPKDFVLVVCGFTMGTMPALVATVLVSLLEWLTVGTTGPIGFVMNLLSSAMFVCPAAGLYHRRHSLRGAALGLLAGTLAATAVMLLWNYLIAPLYMGTPREAIAEMLLPVFLPFNLVKGGLNAAIALLVYKPISRALRVNKLLPADSRATAVPRRQGKLMKLAALLVLASCILAVLAMRGII